MTDVWRRVDLRGAGVVGSSNVPARFTGDHLIRPYVLLIKNAATADVVTHKITATGEHGFGGIAVEIERGACLWPTIGLVRIDFVAKVVSRVRSIAVVVEPHRVVAELVSGFAGRNLALFGVIDAGKRMKIGDADLAFIAIGVTVLLAVRRIGKDLRGGRGRRGH